MKGLFWVLMFSGLAACGGPDSYAEREAFQGPSRHQREFRSDAASLCAAARRVLLGDGYVVTAQSNNLLVGEKEFNAEDQQRAVIRLHVACEPRSRGATLFLTATEELFDIRTTRQSSSFGLPILAPITYHSSKESGQTIKLQGETVTTPTLYENFYRAVQGELGR